MELEGFKGVKLFVGALPMQATDSDLGAPFLQFTPVIHAKVEIGRQLGISRGFGYVRLSDPGVIPAILASEIYVLGTKVDVQVARQKKCSLPKTPGQSSHFTGSDRSHPTTREGTPAYRFPPASRFAQPSQGGRNISSMLNYGNSKFAEYLKVNNPLQTSDRDIQRHNQIIAQLSANNPQKMSRPSRWAKMALNQNENNYRFNRVLISTNTVSVGRTDHPLLYHLF